MWLSRQGRGNGNAEAGAELGTVTLAGDRPSVYLSGERRDLPLMGPGGYLWRPAPGQRVLVIKAGDVYKRQLLGYGDVESILVLVAPDDAGNYSMGDNDFANLSALILPY